MQFVIRISVKTEYEEPEISGFSPIMAMLAHILPTIIDAIKPPQKSGASRPEEKSKSEPEPKAESDIGVIYPPI